MTDDREDRIAGRRRLLAMVALVGLGLALCALAAWLGLWSLGRGLTTPGGEADMTSELLGIAAMLVAVTAGAVFVGGARVMMTGWPLPRAFLRRLTIIYAAVMAAVLVVLLVRGG